MWLCVLHYRNNDLDIGAGAKVPSSFEQLSGGACGWIAKKSGVRGVENLRYCLLREGTLTFYENEVGASNQSELVKSELLQWCDPDDRWC
jgi:hypothetical protein